MQYQVFLQLRPAESALIRVLGTIERRGFTPVAMNAETKIAETKIDGWAVSLTVQGDRSGETLQAQLAKLQDCQHVEVRPAEVFSSLHTPAPASAKVSQL